MRMWGLGRSGGVIFIVKFIKRLAQKLRRFILLHFGVVTCRCHFEKTQKVIIFMFFGLGGRVHDSQNQYHLSLETLGYSKIQEQSRIIFHKYDFWKYQNFGNRKF